MGSLKLKEEASTLFIPPPNEMTDSIRQDLLVCNDLIWLLFRNRGGKTSCILLSFVFIITLYMQSSVEHLKTDGADEIFNCPSFCCVIALVGCPYPGLSCVCNV